MASAPSLKSQAAALLENKALLLFLAARSCSALAAQMLAVAVGWQIYALTGSAFYLGLVGLAQFLPLFLLTLVVGQVADRYNRRSVVRICQFIEGAGTLLLAWGSFHGWLNKESILAIVFLLGAARAFEGPALQAMLPGLVSVAFFSSAVAWSAASFQTASIIGPALGGLLYAAGPATVYVAIGLMFLGACLCVSCIRLERAGRAGTPGGERTVASIFAGITFIRSKPEILGAISLDLFAVLLGGATALLPVYARNILFTGPVGLGVLRAAPAIGALLTSVFLARYPLRRNAGRKMFAAVAVFGLATIAFALSTSFTLSLAVLIVLGAADVISVVVRSSLVQLETPDEMRGRVTAVNSMFVGTSNQLGEFESGLTAAWFGAVPAVLIGGVGTLVVVILWMRLFPSLVRIESLERGEGS